MNMMFPTPRAQRWQYVLFIIIVLLAIGALIVACIAIVLDIQQLVEYNRRAMDIQRGIQRLENVLSTLKDAETGQRGYLLTGVDSYLEPYQSAIDSINPQMSTLRTQFAGDAAVLQQLRSLQTMIEGKLAILDLTIRARRIGGLSAAQAIVEANAGKNVMDALRKLIKEMTDAQNTILVERQAEAARSNDRAIELAQLTGLLAVLLLGAAFSAVIWQNHQSQLAAAAARREKHFSEQITDTAPISVFMYDTEQRQFTFVNQRFREMFNIAADAVADLDEEFYGRLLHPTSNMARHELSAKILNLKDSQTLIEELYVRDARDSWRWLELRLKIFDRLPNGKPRTVLGTMTDITDQKQAAERLQASEMRYRQLARHLPDTAVMMFDHNLVYILAEGEALTRLGMQREAIEGRSLDEVATPENLDSLRVAFFSALGGNSSNFELISRGRQFNLTVLPVGDGFGHIMGGMVVSLDVTRQKNIENELRQSHEFVERVTNSLPGLVVVYDAETLKYVFINRQAQTTIELVEQGTMYPPHVILRMLLHPDDVRQHDESWRQLMSDPTRIIQSELRLRGERDPWRWMSVQYLVLSFTPANQPKQVLLTAWDITVQKVAEQQAGQLALETERSALIKKFIETASHDLNTPLTVAMTAGYMVQAYTNRYLERHSKHTSETSIYDALKLAENLKGQHEKLNPALDRLKIIIANMIEMVQIDFELTLNCQMLDLDPLVDKLVLQMQARSHDRQLIFNRIASQGLPSGCFDSDYMQRAISNLLLNAIMYTPDDGTITVSTAERDGAIVIQISDTGIGIPAESLAHIFDRFYRVDESRRVSTGGNGLGLSIAKRIIEGHGGHIEVESILGEGSTFRIVLPVRTDSAST